MFSFEAHVKLLSLFAIVIQIKVNAKAWNIVYTLAFDWLQMIPLVFLVTLGWLRFYYYSHNNELPKWAKFLNQDILGPYDLTQEAASSGDTGSRDTREIRISKTFFFIISFFLSMYFFLSIWTCFGSSLLFLCFIQIDFECFPLDSNISGGIEFRKMKTRFMKIGTNFYFISVTEKAEEITHLDLVLWCTDAVGISSSDPSQASPPNRSRPGSCLYQSQLHLFCVHNDCRHFSNCQN